MVNTWDDSWFKEEGVRVLYLLPRAWTDEILPMKIAPLPKQLVRVMVGRAEIITPETDNKLTLELTAARQGRPGAEGEVQATLNKLGRFANPVFNRALARIDAQPIERDKWMALLYQKRYVPE